MKNISKALILGISMIMCAYIIGAAYKYKFRAQDTIVVTGLGEKEFVSDLIVWRGCIVAQSNNVADGYRQLEQYKKEVSDYIRSKGVADSSVVFNFVNSNKMNDPIYNNGQYVGQKFTGYELRQTFNVESKNVEAVESISREISALIAQGVQIESWQPEYYYTGLEGLKLKLIEQATEDARQRAKGIADEADCKLGRLQSGRMGVFQITGANTDEAFSSGGSFNTNSKIKKARITMRLEYHIK